MRCAHANKPAGRPSVARVGYIFVFFGYEHSDAASVYGIIHTKGRGELVLVSSHLNAASHYHVPRTMAQSIECEARCSQTYSRHHQFKCIRFSFAGMREAKSGQTVGLIWCEMVAVCARITLQSYIWSPADTEFRMPNMLFVICAAYRLLDWHAVNGTPNYRLRPDKWNMFSE